MDIIFAQPVLIDNTSAERANDMGGVRFRNQDGMLQINVRHPKFSHTGVASLHQISSTGKIELMACPVVPSPGGPTDRPQYNYDDKYRVLLEATDVITLLQTPIQQTVSIAVTNRSTGGKAVQRKLNIAPVGSAAAAPGGAPPKPASFTLTVQDEGRTITVSLQYSEMFLLRNLVGLALPWITGWQQHLDPGSFDPSVHLATPREDGAATEGASPAQAQGGQAGQGGAASSGGYGHRGGYSGYSRGGYGGGQKYGGGQGGGYSRGGYGGQSGGQGGYSGGYNRGPAGGQGGQMQ